MRKAFLFFTILVIAKPSFAQAQTNRLKLFVDCSNTWCDMNYLKTEINLVDFVVDNKAADLHVLITEQNTGGGGDQYQLIFFGQNQFKNIPDTLRFSTDASATDFEERDLLTKYLKLGLAPFIAKTAAAKDVTIDLKSKETTKSTVETSTKDPWNYWTFQIGSNGSVNGDKVYKGVRYNGNLSASRITDKIKITFRVNGGKNKTTYDFETLNGNTKYVVNNNNYSFYHQIVKSINEHWSYGYNMNAGHNTFSNMKLSLELNPAIEYNVYPYKDVNTRFFSIRYGVDVRRNRYIDTTIYFKTQETLFGHGINSSLSFNQKWGTTSFGMSYHNFFHNWKYFNLGINGDLNIRITGGLSINFFAFAGLVRDQLSLSGEGATEQEVLTRRRQLASSYNYYTSFGLNYRFGSKINNFVNPRFQGGGGSFFFFN